MESVKTKAFWSLLSIAIVSIIAGGLIGASINAINGRVSPLYFRTVMQWGYVEDIAHASIAQGIFEGVLFGVVFATMFTATVGLVSRRKCSFSLAFRYLLRMVASIYILWVLGSVIFHVRETITFSLLKFWGHHSLLVHVAIILLFMLIRIDKHTGVERAKLCGGHAFVAVKEPPEVESSAKSAGVGNPIHGFVCVH
jgi:hypothetical protein